MDNTNWNQLALLFDQLLILPESEHEAFLDKQCLSSSMRETLVSLIHNHDSSTKYFDSLFNEVVQEAYSNLPVLLLKSRLVGNYKILKNIGFGGMGSVYLAERADDIYETRVAIKILNPHTDSDDILERFLSERQILARLNHPNITHLLDGGLTDDNHPYFVMEYVEGKPITAFCDENRLNIGERLRLILQVGDAIQYAHNNLVIHRDLKPGNILVTNEGTVKLIDFGIANLIADRIISPVSSTSALHSGPQLMTPEYASPEQLQQSPVTTQSDVYQLGVLLFEQISGCKPFDFPNKSPEEILNTILKDNTSVASCRYLDSGKCPEISLCRSEKPGKLAQTLKGDLDAIAAKAIHTDLNRRYSSIKEFMDDINRYLSGFPVLAREGGPGYTGRKFLKRNRLPAGISAFFLLMLMLISIFYFTTVSNERNIALSEAAKAKQVSDFLISLFEDVSSHEVDPNAISASMILDQGINRSILKAGDQPDLSAHFIELIGDTYHTMGILDKSAETLEKSLEIKKQIHGPIHQEVSVALNKLGYVQMRKRDPEAIQTLREAVSIQDQLPEKNAQTYIESMLYLADAVELIHGKSEHSAQNYRRYFEEVQSFYGNDHSEIIQAKIIYLFGQPEPDRKLLERAFRDQISILKTEHGENHPLVGDALNRFGLYLEPYNPEESISLVRQAHHIFVDNYGIRHDKSIVIQTNLAALLRDQGLYDEAETQYRSVLELSDETKLKGSSVFIYRLIGLGRVLLHKGDFVDAEPYLREGLILFERHFNGYSPMIITTKNYLGQCLTALGKLDEAEEVLLSAYDELQENEESNTELTDITTRLLASLYLAGGDTEKAALFSTDSQ